MSSGLQGWGLLSGTWLWCDLGQEKYWLDWLDWCELKEVVGDMGLDWLVCIQKAPQGQTVYYHWELFRPGRGSVSRNSKTPGCQSTIKHTKLNT